MKNHTHSNKGAEKMNKLIRDIPTEHINLAMKKAAINGEFRFNFTQYMLDLLAKDVDRRIAKRPQLKK